MEKENEKNKLQNSLKKLQKKFYEIFSKKNQSENKIFVFKRKINYKYFTYKDALDNLGFVEQEIEINAEGFEDFDDE